jgi:membrane fusion protein, macrolide-specific efflux system
MIKNGGKVMINRQNHNLRGLNFIKKLAIAVSIGVITSSFTGCFLLPAEEETLAPPLVEPPKITFETVAAKIGTIEKKITVSGTFSSVHQENLYFKFRGGFLKNIDAKLGDRVSKGEVIAELDTDSLQSEIKQMEISLRREQIQYQKVKKAEPPASSLDLELASLNIKSAKLRLDDLKQQYNKARLFAAISGDIVYIDAINSGDYVNANKTLITIADPKKLQLVYQGDNSGDFQQGVKVDVKFQNKVYKGEVVANPNVIPLDANKNAKNSVYIRLNDIPDEAGIGDSAEITLILEKREKVVVVPRNLVNSYSGRNYVQVLENDMKYERDVELGIQTATEVEIKKGVKEGDKLIQR